MNDSTNKATAAAGGARRWRRRTAGALATTAMVGGLVMGTTGPASAGGVEVFGSEAACNTFRNHMIQEGYRVGDCQRVTFYADVHAVYVGERLRPKN